MDSPSLRIGCPLVAALPIHPSASVIDLPLHLSADVGWLFITNQVLPWDRFITPTLPIIHWMGFTMAHSELVSCLIRRFVRPTTTYKEVGLHFAVGMVIVVSVPTSRNSVIRPIVHLPMALLLVSAPKSRKAIIAIRVSALSRPIPRLLPSVRL